MKGRNLIAWRDWQGTLPDGGDWREREAFEDLSYRSTFEHLIAVRRAGDLRKGEFPLICVLRNEAARLPIFFDHYKKLGITRFIMIDNNSDDGSHEILMAEKSADVFCAHVPFAEGQGGLYWANGLAHALCRDHWTLRVDADELLVYDEMDRHGLPDLTRWLEKDGRDRLLAPMLDVYPSTLITGGAMNVTEMLRDDCWFDAEGYTFERWQEGWHITGGPRKRLFSHGPEEHLTWLTKYPLFRMTEDVSIFNHHYLWPFDTALEQPRGALLHLKLLSDFAERSRRYEKEGQHAMNSRAYRIINSLLAEMGPVSVRCDSSRRYEGPQSLIEHGLMQPIDWLNETAGKTPGHSVFD